MQPLCQQKGVSRIPPLTHANNKKDEQAAPPLPAPQGPGERPGAKNLTERMGEPNRGAPGKGGPLGPSGERQTTGRTYTAEGGNSSSSFIFLIFSTRVVRFMLRSSAALALTQLDSFRA